MPRSPEITPIRVYLPETHTQINVPFNPFARLPEEFIDLMQRGIARAITADFVFKGVKGQLLVWGGLNGYISPEDYEGEDPKFPWEATKPHYELYPELLIPPIDPAYELLKRYSLRLRGILYQSGIEKIFGQVAHEVFQDHRHKGRLSLGDIPSVLVEVAKIHEIEATWIPKN